jgi:hypothetical protein
MQRKQQVFPTDFRQRKKLKRKQQRTKIEHEHMVHIVGRFMKVEDKASNSLCNYRSASPPLPSKKYGGMPKFCFSIAYWK